MSSQKKTEQASAAYYDAVRIMTSFGFHDEAEMVKMPLFAELVKHFLEAESETKQLLKD